VAFAPAQAGQLHSAGVLYGAAQARQNLTADGIPDWPQFPQSHCSTRGRSDAHCVHAVRAALFTLWHAPLGHIHRPTGGAWHHAWYREAALTTSLVAAYNRRRSIVFLPHIEGPPLVAAGNFDSKKHKPDTGTRTSDGPSRFVLGIQARREQRKRGPDDDASQFFHVARLTLAPLALPDRIRVSCK
jgi:hypothetical protein